MMQRICQVIGDIYPDAQFDPVINIAHNYACRENHFDENVIVHRKGATSARLGETGIIHAIRGQSDLEEAAGAYKDIDKVMADQTDLVKIVTELVPVAVIKG